MIVVLRMLAVFLLAVTSVAAAEPELMVVVSVMGYGYKVTMLVNGVDIGVQGGKSEGRRLFNKDNPMASQASPNVRARNFPLRRGANQVSIEYSKLDPKNADALEITMEAEGYPQPLLKLLNRSKNADKLGATIVVEPKAPAGFKTALLGDAK
jgi:hypothetical protein